MKKEIYFVIAILLLKSIVSIAKTQKSYNKKMLEINNFYHQKNDTSKREYKFRINLNFGVSRTLGAIHDNPIISKEYYDKLSIGRVINLSATYFHFRKIGLGIDLSSNYNSSSTTVRWPIPSKNGQYIYEQIPLSNQIATYYFAPQIMFRNFLGKNNIQSITSFSLGAGVKNSLVTFLNSDLNSSFYLGSLLSQGFDFSLTKNILIGFETRLFIAGFRDIIDATKTSNNMFSFPLIGKSISRFEVTVGIRLNSVFEN